MLPLRAAGWSYGQCPHPLAGLLLCKPYVMKDDPVDCLEPHARPVSPVGKTRAARLGQAHHGSWPEDGETSAQRKERWLDFHRSIQSRCAGCEIRPVRPSIRRCGVGRGTRRSNTGQPACNHEPCFIVCNVPLPRWSPRYNPTPDVWTTDQGLGTICHQGLD